MEIGCLLAAYLQALASEFVAVVPPRKYCQAVQRQTATGSDEFCRNSEQLVSYSISEITVHKITSKREERPTPQGAKDGSCNPMPSDMR